MSEHRLRRDMIECGLLPRTGTSDDAVAELRGLRLEARIVRASTRPARTRPARRWLGPVLAVVLAVVAIMLSWSALAVLPTALGVAVVLGSTRSVSPRRTTVAAAPRVTRQRQRQ